MVTQSQTEESEKAGVVVVGEAPCTRAFLLLAGGGASSAGGVFGEEFRSTRRADLWRSFGNKINSQWAAVGTGAAP